MNAGGDPNGQPAPQLNEEGLPINPEPKVEEKIPPEIIKDIESVWSVFCMADTDHVSMDDLRTILRALDQDLTEQELEETKFKIDPEMKVIKYENLKLVMEERLKPKGTVEELKALFKTLDVNEDGLIPQPEFKRYMVNLGMKLPEDEFLLMLKEAGNEPMIDIASFAERLCPKAPPAKKKKGKKKKK